MKHSVNTKLWYGRRKKSSGAPPKRTKRSAFALAPGSEHLEKPKHVGTDGSRKGGSFAVLKPRWLSGCGHQVLMLKGQYPSEETICPQCHKN